MCGELESSSSSRVQVICNPSLHGTEHSPTRILEVSARSRIPEMMAWQGDPLSMSQPPVSCSVPGSAEVVQWYEDNLLPTSRQGVPTNTLTDLLHVPTAVQRGMCNTSNFSHRGPWSGSVQVAPRSRIPCCTKWWPGREIPPHHLFRPSHMTCLQVSARSWSQSSLPSSTPGSPEQHEQGRHCQVLMGDECNRATQ